jgi:Domain of unknown function (DUF4145)
MAWMCPYCNQIATITTNDVSNNTHRFQLRNKEKCELQLQTYVTVCPNDRCREYVITASLFKTKLGGTSSNPHWDRIEDSAQTWLLRPKSKAKPFPEYIPLPLLKDYEEACLILNDSPKASATLSRRCLQGIIRDFWGISKDRLIDEIKELKGKVDGSTWKAIDAVRSIGNIGAHMEKDINLIVDVDPGEAEILIRLLETLFKDWYVNRYEREEHMQEIIAVAQSKADQKTKLQVAATESTNADN